MAGRARRGRQSAIAEESSQMKSALRTFRCTLAVMGALACGAPAAFAHKIYLANDNHTDYGWNARTDVYDQSMAAEIDYYLAQRVLTATNPSAEEARFNADCWWYLYLYERNRTSAEFEELIGAMRSGHITVPLNPFVELYGALPTEAAIRAGYYPGRIERRYGVEFLLGQDIENATIPWGLASLWAGSFVRYSWKGLCECLHRAPFADRTEEVFRWQGPDGKELLMKWYQPSGGTSGKSWGGYAEARNHLSVAGIQAAIDRFSTRPPLLPVTGLFGAGWDDVSYTTDTFWRLAQQWNLAHPGGDQVIVSNGIDYFQELEQYRDLLPVLRGGWGNDWDLWPAALSARTTQVRTALERLRGAEALAAVVHWGDPSVWTAQQPALEAGLIDVFKYFEHTWGSGGVGLPYVVDNKRAWAQSVEQAVAGLEADAAAAFARAFTTPDEDRFVVFNPLGSPRTDFADLPVAASGPHVVIDVATGAEAPSQVITIGDQLFLRVLARDVPALGYRVYRYAPGEPAPIADAATIAGATITSSRYRVTLGAAGQITSAVDLGANRELAGPVLNDFGSGGRAQAAAENVGPVSATLRAEVLGPPARRVRVTLLRDVDRIEIEDEILEAVGGNRFYRFAMNVTDPTIHFEEVGAIARPGLVADGGDFLPGTRADGMTLNHFAAVSGGGYTVDLSNWDAYAMRTGTSTTTAFATGTAEVNVLALGNPSGSPITNQGGDTRFRHRFALRGRAGAFSGAQAMAMSLAHQNPLRALALPRNQAGPFCAPTAGLLSVDAPNVLVTAFKPAEEGERGLVVRLWELEGRDTTTAINAAALSPCAAFEVSLIETDVRPVVVDGGRVPVQLAPNEIKTYRLVPRALSAASCAGGDAGTGCVLCGTAAECADADPCTTDGCTAAGLCEHTPSTSCSPCTEDADCDDANPCNGIETCDLANGCQMGQPLRCDDGQLCNGLEVCDLVAGCVVESLPSCGDGVDCTEDGCDPAAAGGTGACVHRVNHDICRDNNPCTDDRCDAQAGCVYDFNTDVCSDDFLCNGPERCLDGSCLNVGPAVDCRSLDDACRVGVCDELTGTCTAEPANEGGACDDGSPCSLGDRCTGGACVGSPRTADACVALGDVDCDGRAATPIDAQAILCLAAGRCSDMDVPGRCSDPRVRLERADWDLDGVLTADDARSTLRVFVRRGDATGMPLASCCTGQLLP
jgi:alpha-mannosidase